MLDFERSHGPRTASSIIGRDREREVLSESFQHATEGRNTLVLLGGEAGVGKTTLIDEIVWEARERGAAILAGHCYDRSSSPPYGPWIEIVRDSFSDGTDAVAPDFLTREGEAGSLQSQMQLFEHTLRYLEARIDDSVLVLVLEDIHWADQASLDLFHFVSSQLVDRPVLIIGSYRDALSRQDPLYRVLPALIRDCKALRVDLYPFRRSTTNELIANHYQLTEEDQHRLAIYLQARTEGNPFFIHELLRTLESEAMLQEVNGVWQLGDVERAPVPVLVRQVIDQGLDKLGPDARSALEIAAVIGQEFPFALWRALCELDQQQMLSLVKLAWDARVLSESPDGSRIRFSHALVREALYEGLVQPERRQLHQRTAEALLDDRSGIDPDEVAHHFELASDARAIPWLMKAGLRAERGYAWMEAIQRYEKVFELLGQPGESVQARGWLAYHIGGLVRYGDLTKCVHYLREAGRLAVEAGDELLSGISAYHLEFLQDDDIRLDERIRRMEASLAVIVRMTSDDHQRAQKSLAALFPPEVFTDLRTKPENIIPRFNALPGFNVLNDGLNLQRGLAGLFQETLEKGQAYVDGVESATSSVSVARNVCRDTYLSFAVSYHGLGKPEQSDEWFDRTVEAYQAVNHHAQLGTALSWRLRHVLVYRTDRISERRSLQDAAQRALATAGGIQKPSGGPLAVIEGHFELALLEGRWDDAEEIAVHALQRARFWEREGPTAALATLHRLRGETSDAEDLLRTALPAGPDTAPGASRFFPTTRLIRLGAKLALDSGDLEGARPWLDALDRWQEWSSARAGLASASLLRAEYHRASGDVDAARRLASQAGEQAGDPGQPVELIAAKRMLGEIAILQCNFDEANEQLRESLHLTDACEAPYERALGLIARAGLETAWGSSTSALSLLATARNICFPLRAQLALQQIERLDGQLAGSTRQAAPGYPAGLSEREVEVLRLVAAGKSNRDIAGELFLSIRTIERHVSNIYTKIGSRGRAAATGFALQNDLA